MKFKKSATGARRLNYFGKRSSSPKFDFVLVRSGKVLCIEVKSGSSQQASGIAAFQKQIQPDRLLLIGNSGIPWEEFLKINPVELF